MWGVINKWERSVKSTAIVCRRSLKGFHKGGGNGRGRIPDRDPITTTK
jgi:hypothetical protein